MVYNKLMANGKEYIEQVTVDQVIKPEVLTCTPDPKKQLRTISERFPDEETEHQKRSKIRATTSALIDTS